MIKNVALLSGYCDPLYFYGVFRQSVGVMPSEFLCRKAEEKGLAHQ